MKYKYCLIIFLFFLTVCCKDFLIKDKEFSMKAILYTGNELKINGYYYKKYSDEKSLVLVFYENGVQFGGNGISIPTIEIEDRLRESDYTRKLRDWLAWWAPYDIYNNVLRFEFYDIFGHNWHTCIAHCEILNDTTFNVKKITFSKTGKEVNVNKYGTSYYSLGEWHFKQFSPKPDSTNIFIP